MWNFHENFVVTSWWRLRSRHSFFRRTRSPTRYRTSERHNTLLNWWTYHISKKCAQLSDIYFIQDGYLIMMFWIGIPHLNWRITTKRIKIRVMGRMRGSFSNGAVTRLLVPEISHIFCSVIFQSFLGEKTYSRAIVFTIFYSMLSCPFWAYYLLNETIWSAHVHLQSFWAKKKGNFLGILCEISGATTDISSEQRSIRRSNTNGATVVS